MSRILRSLWENHGAPKLDRHLHRFPGLRPRNVTATEVERDTILAAAEPHLRLLILLCSDLAIRSGTAAKIAPEHYDRAQRALRFPTKCGERLTLPATTEISALIETCNPDDPAPYVYQLWRRAYTRGPRPFATNDPSRLRFQFKQLRERLGITRKLTLHDLRRTTAVAMLEATHDIRDVQALLGHRSLQSTIWYLDHDLRPVKRSTLEKLKRPAWRKERTA
jgi:integrase